MRTPERPSPRKTCRRYNTPGHAHALTFGCFRGLPLLKSRRTCAWLIDSLDRARARHEFDLWAFVVMPDHVHLLIHPRHERYDISGIFRSIKMPVARAAIRFLRERFPKYLSKLAERNSAGAIRSYRFWRVGGGYDRNLWEPGYVWETTRYIHGNPVRRGLCQDPTDWYWSSARAYESGSDEPLRIDIESLPVEP